MQQPFTICIVVWGSWKSKLWSPNSEAHILASSKHIHQPLSEIIRERSPCAVLPTQWSYRFDWRNQAKAAFIQFSLCVEQGILYIRNWSRALWICSKLGSSSLFKLNRPARRFLLVFRVQWAVSTASISKQSLTALTNVNLQWPLNLDAAIFPFLDYCIKLLIEAQEPRMWLSN